jgi:hypothetical protein
MCWRGLLCLSGCLLAAGALPAAGQSLLAGGHTKLRLTAADYPDDSVMEAFADDPSYDQGAGLRLKFSSQGSGWAAAADYQVIGVFGDSLDLDRELAGSAFFPTQVLNDDHRLMDLTYAFSDNSDRVVLHRLDRLYGEIRRDKWITRLGRQAVSWGNGLIYTPMDFLNPFDPAAVDTEYKTGDDMAYGQYLRDNGDDWQAVWVVRRDDEKNLDRQVNSSALKYHGFAGEAEYDLLIAEHYDDTIVGLGGSIPWGGAVLRADLTFTDTSDESTWSGVASWSWSWIGFDKNMSGVLEYFYNGFGQGGEKYSPVELRSNPDLVQRLARGELFTLGRHYLGGSVLVEVTPLLHISPNMFVNLADGSLLAQLVASYDVAQDWQLLASLNVPVGSSDTEYGGFDSGINNLEFHAGPSLFAQLAWYF